MYRGLALLVVACALIAVGACGTEPVGIDACKRIERVRCESAQACNIDLSHPIHEGNSPEANVAACIRYYDDQCLHGLVVTVEPSPQEVDACVDAIIKGTCDVVREPQRDLACSFLVPPNTSTATDASTDTSTSTVTDSGTTDQ